MHSDLELNGLQQTPDRQLLDNDAARARLRRRHRRQQKRAPREQGAWPWTNYVLLLVGRLWPDFGGVSQ